MSTDRTVLDVDYAVIGLGAMGASTLYFLARSDAKVVGIDQYSPPHTLGASHGGYRVTREAVAEGPAYLHFVRRSNALLSDLERRHGVGLVGRTGTLIVGSDAAGRSSFLRDTVEIAKANGIEHQLLSSNDLRQRYPQLVGLDKDEVGYFEPASGFIRPEPLLNLQIALAREAGAEIFENTAVNRISPLDGGVEVEAGGIRIRARKVVVAAGRWLGSLLGGQSGDLLSVTRQRTFSFRASDEPAYRTGKFPTLMWFRKSVGGECATVFPLEAAEGALKFFVADTEADGPDGLSGDDFYDRHVQPFFAGVSRQLHSSQPCFYTSTPDHGFILDWHPQIPGLFLVSACSGHGFKHALGIGEAVAGLFADRPVIDLSAFNLARFAANKLPR
ncbi:MAG TPA: N-methyl-L-tryptophan oxidase [Ensifer sp.]|jgi:sarcosine oxidase|uniref:N-methyl-L-tryptophan oxidase n=1 Tax=Ensifer sp. TaxID=1872086 RepID=UPI002E0F44B6|nr:N-methyl-L-tryptophan oxidase [Ensifer sp.]